MCIRDSLSADNVRENNLCVIFLMSKYDPQRKGAYETDVYKRQHEEVAVIAH